MVPCPGRICCKQGLSCGCTGVICSCDSAVRPMQCRDAMLRPQFEALSLCYCAKSGRERLNNGSPLQAGPIQGGTSPSIGDSVCPVWRDLCGQYSSRRRLQGSKANPAYHHPNHWYSQSAPAVWNYLSVLSDILDNYSSVNC